MFSRPKSIIKEQKESGLLLGIGNLPVIGDAGVVQEKSNELTEEIHDQEQKMRIEEQDAGQQHGY